MVVEHEDVAQTLKKKLSSRMIREGSYTLLCFGAAIVTILTTLGIIFSLVHETSLFFQNVSAKEFFTANEWTPLFSEGKYGIRALLNGTFMIALGSSVVALPIGLLIALYLSEYATPRLKRIVKPMMELLAGIPSVVYGFFAVSFVTPFLKQLGLPVATYNALAGALVVGIMVLPLVASLSEDAISSVPKAIREAAYGLGASKAEVATTVVLKSATSGIIASFILAISRAVGETLAVTLAAGAQPTVAFNFLESIQTMTAYIVQVSSGDVPRTGPQYQSLFAVGITLFVITLALNLLASQFVRRVMRHHK